MFSNQSSLAAVRWLLVVETLRPKAVDLMGCIVTIDAAGCQKKIVRKIVDKHADYLISLKGNQSTEGALCAKRSVFQRPVTSNQQN